MTKLAEVKNWYDRMYVQKGKAFTRPPDAFPIFLDYLNINGGENFIDIGCGRGDLLLSASQRGLRTFGVDLSDEAVKISQTVSPDSFVCNSPAESIPFPDGFFDYVTCIGSLEHFVDMDKSLTEMIRVMKDNARLCVSVPNSNFIYWRIFGNSGTPQKEMIERLMSFHEWQDLFENNGFEIVGVYQDKWHSRKLKVWESANPVKIIEKLFLKFAWWVLPLRWTYHFVFLLRKK